MAIAPVSLEEDDGSKPAGSGEEDGDGGEDGEDEGLLAENRANRQWRR